MKYDPQDRALRFADDREAAALRLQLTALFREAIGEAHAGLGDAAEAPGRSRAVMKRYPAVLRAMNALRRGGAGAGEDEEADPAA